MPDDPSGPDTPNTSRSLFDQIRSETPEGDEYWSARDLGPVLGYVRWENFRAAIDRAIIACANSGQPTDDHFRATTKMITTGKGAQREVEDFHLSRYACYLVVQNADPEKEVVALGQTYFAVQTRRAEEADALAGLTEAQRRLVLRDQLTSHNRLLAATAMSAGVIHALDFAIFQDHGYRGLYGGLSARDIHARKGLKPNQGILDHMGAEELAANLFRATQTEAKIRREEIQGKEAANKAHADMARAVRGFLVEQGSTMPEDLPTPNESIQQVRQEEKKRLQRGPQLPLFGEDDTSSE